MLDALTAIACFDRMRALSHQGGFTVAELVSAGSADHAVRGYLRYCLDQKAVETVPERHIVNGRHVIRYRVLSTLAPVLVTDQDQVPQIREALRSRLVRRASDREVANRQANLWTALRALRVAELRALAFHAQTEAVLIRATHARSYCAKLAATGYVSLSEDGHVRLSVRRNTGPFPVLIIGNTLLDLNLMRAVNVTAQPSLQHGGRAA